MNMNNSVNTGSAMNSSPHQLSRREFFVAGITVLGLPALEVTAKSFGQNRQLLKPIHEQIVCRWSPRHPRHDHQLIFPLDDERLLLVWSEYYSTQENSQQQIGKLFFSTSAVVRLPETLPFGCPTSES